MISDQAMRELEDKASEPWEVSYEGSKVNHETNMMELEVSIVGMTSPQNDAAFIAASRDWVPDALDRLDRIRALIDPSKAVKGSVASKILQILDGDDQ